jgi:hypothetical protein
MDSGDAIGGVDPIEEGDPDEGGDKEEGWGRKGEQAEGGRFVAELERE